MQIKNREWPRVQSSRGRCPSFGSAMMAGLGTCTMYDTTSTATTTIDVKNNIMVLVHMRPLFSRRIIIKHTPSQPSRRKHHRIVLHRSFLNGFIDLRIRRRSTVGLGSMEAKNACTYRLVDANYRLVTKYPHEHGILSFVVRLNQVNRSFDHGRVHDVEVYHNVVALRRPQATVK